jgi:hypothetical protein
MLIGQGIGIGHMAHVLFYPYSTTSLSLSLSVPFHRVVEARCGGVAQVCPVGYDTITGSGDDGGGVDSKQGLLVACARLRNPPTFILGNESLFVFMGSFYSFFRRRRNLGTCPTHSEQDFVYAQGRVAEQGFRGRAHDG